MSGHVGGYDVNGDAAGGGDAGDPSAYLPDADKKTHEKMWLFSHDKKAPLAAASYGSLPSEARSLVLSSVIQLSFPLTRFL